MYSEDSSKKRPEVIKCPPGYAITYTKEFEYGGENWHEEFYPVLDSHSPAMDSYSRLWLAVIREALIDLKNPEPSGELHKQMKESFQWLFRDKATFPTIASLLGYDYRYLRKALIRLVRSHKRALNFRLQSSFIMIPSKKMENPMKDLESLHYNQLQKLAKENGINCKGLKKEAIILALQELSLKELEQETAPTAAIQKTISPVTVAKSPKIITDLDDIYGLAPKTLKINIETQKIIEECNKIFANSRYPDARARPSTSGEGIDFLGGPKEQQFVTIHQPARTIYYYANFYVQKVIKDEGKVDAELKELAPKKINRPNA